MHQGKILKLENLRKIMLFAQAGLLIAFAHWTWLGYWFVSFTIPLLSALLYSSYVIANRGYIILGTSIFLIAINTFAIGCMWKYSGLQDETIMLLPAILFLSAILGNFRLLLGLLIFDCLFLLLIGGLNHYDFRINELPRNDLNSAALLVLILCMIAYCIWIIAGQFRRVMDKLELENKKYRLSQQQIKQLINHDPLTGLPNRRRAAELFSQALKSDQQNDRFVAITFIDLDNFKSINDSLGHRLGDLYLKKVAECINSVLRQHDSLCRFGGDEFVIISTQYQDLSQVKIMANRIIQHTATPLLIENNELMLTCSMGIALAPEHGHQFESICQRADMAMYQAKAKGRNCFSIFNQTMSEELNKKITLEQELRSAIQQQQLELHYQSKICLKSNKVTSAEALLRWKHPTMGNITPDHFVPVAEKCGLMADLGDWVLENAIAQCKELQNNNLNIKIAVNVSPVQFLRGRFERRLKALLQKYQLDGCQLILELTESVFLESKPELKDSLAAIRQLGIALSIDDFGTGYSNLTYLQQFEISQLKIDKSFVLNIIENKQDKIIVDTIVQMTNSLGIDCVAEGVESEEAAKLLTDMGCEYGQGFYWSRPVDFSTLMTALTSEKRDEQTKVMQLEQFNSAVS